MRLRVATFNVENLFARPSAMAAGSGAAGQRAIDDHAELNRIVEQPAYTGADKARLVALEQRYRFAALNPPSNALVRLQKVRGQLYSRSTAGVVSVKAAGRGDWTGWFDLRRDDVRWQATFNTARVIAEVDPDILICVEAENRPALVKFNEQVLAAQLQRGFPHVMVVDGNDDRGIDVGLMSRYPITTVRPHVDDLGADGNRTFSRDCPEYLVRIDSRRAVVVMPNHFKSKRGGNDTSAQKRRVAQGTAAAAIATRALATSSRVIVGGDLNDTPDSAALAPLLAAGFTDVQMHASYPKDRPGTFGTGLARDKIDYLLLSPALATRLRQTGIERRGAYHPTVWKPFDSVASAADQASDHHLVWADFVL